jgi:hypothetical protein
MLKLQCLAGLATIQSSEHVYWFSLQVMLQQVQVMPNGRKEVRTALEWTKWMEGLLLSAAVCREIVCIKIGKPRCSTCCCLLLCVEGSCVSK